MRRVVQLLGVLLLTLSACSFPKPEIPLTEAPAAPLLTALHERRAAFSGLKAVASVQAMKKGRKRSLDSVGVVLQDQKKLRMEAFSPLGTPLAVLAWDGGEVLLRLAGNGRVLRAGQAGIEKLLGEGIEPAELAALLSGNIPATSQTVGARAFCGAGGLCRIEIPAGDQERRVWVQSPGGGAGGNMTVTSSELYRAGQLVYRVRFSRFEEHSRYALPTWIVVENPDKKMSLTVEYNDVSVNVPIDDAVFHLSGAEGAQP